MKKRLFATLFGVLSALAPALADDINYSGTVVSKSGEPIMGATVTVTGTTVSTITDMDGHFSLVVPDGYTTVTVTYSGMKKQTVSVQREPVVLYETAEQAEQALLASKKAVKPKRNYKRNAFNLEIGYGGAMGDWGDYTDYALESDEYLSLNLGWHHNFNQYIGWEVLNFGALAPTNFDKDYDYISAYVTTGVKVTSPSWKKLSVFYSFNIGVHWCSSTDDADGVDLIIRNRFGVNFNKWVYVAANYNVVKLSDKAKETLYGYSYNDAPNIGVMTIALGFNF